MKHLFHSFFAIILFCLLGTQSAQAQNPLITDTTTTTSICFNDGTIHVAATGGTGAYTFSIISGPTFPNITYPINIPTGTTLFQTIPAGHYTIQVTDAGGHTSTATATVPGTYTFPSNVSSVSGGCINNVPSGGLGPYQFSLSTVSASTGFNTYQNSSSFCGLCNGYYWVRVRDNCGNIFTSVRLQVVIPVPDLDVACHLGSRDTLVASLIGYSGSGPYVYTWHNGAISQSNQTGIFTAPGKRCTPDTITVTDACGQSDMTIVNCNALLAVNVAANCTTGSALIQIVGGIPPYHITGPNTNVNTSLNTVSLNSLPAPPVGNIYTFVVTDSCGQTITQTVNCADTSSLKPIIDNKCGHTPGTIIIEAVPGACYPITVQCVTCTPGQTVVLTGPAMLGTDVFSGLDTGTTYLFRFTDTCGYDYTTSYKPYLASLSLTGPTYFSCNDFVLTSDPTITFSPPISYSLYLFNNLQYTSTSGTFNNLAAGSYMIVASQPTCKNDTLYTNTPRFGARCIVPTYDSACNQSYDIFQGGTDFAERFYFVNTVTGNRYGEVPPGPNDGIYFNDVPVGNYNLVSDSGCSVPVVLPAHDVYTLSLLSYVNCNGQSQINISVSPQPQSCTSPFLFEFGIFKNGQLIKRDTSTVFYTSDTGTYTVKVFYQNRTNFGTLPAFYDTVCAVASQTTYVTNQTVPYIVVKQGRVCGGSSRGNIPLTIFGGSAPYTLQIVGVTTQTVNSNHDTLKNILPGIYTMIVNDACGISTSISVSVIDTCSTACVIRAGYNVSDTVICTRGTITLTNTSTGAATYSWLVNGAPYSTATNISFTPTASGTYIIKLYAYTGSGCIDSFSRRITVTTGVVLNIGRDTTLCAPFTYVLNSHIKNTTWSTGVIDSVITITTGGTYWAQISGACGAGRDSIVITQKPSPVFDLGNDTLLCPGQTLTLHAAVSGATFLWSTGSVDSFLFINTQLTNPIRLTVTKGGCSKTDQINVTYTTPPAPFSLGPDTFICGSGPYILNTHVSYTLWSTGVRDSVISVTGPGTYWAHITNICGSQADTVVITQKPLPVYDLGNDTTLCPGDKLTLNIPLTGVTFQWSTGSTDSFLVIDHQLTNPITVSVTLDGCTKVDRINVTYIFPPAPFSLGPDTFFCDQIYYPLHVPDPTAVWSTGAIDSTIIVTSPGLYWAIESNKCGTETDSVNIGLEHSPTGFDLTNTNSILCIGEPDTAILRAVVNENQPSVRFVWNTGFRDSLVFTSTIAVYDTGTYAVTVDNGKCSLTKTVTIGQEYCDSACLVKLAIPNIFSPNGDGKNDTFHVLHLCPFEPFIMHIYNRWGEKIFESHDIDQGWDGSYRGNQQPEEIYYYWISLTTVTGKSRLHRERVGTVTLVR